MMKTFYILILFFMSVAIGMLAAKSTDAYAFPTGTSSPDSAAASSSQNGKETTVNGTAHDTPVKPDETAEAASVETKPGELDPNDKNTGGAGDLLIAPTHVVLEGRTRSAEITLNNKGTKEATYRVSFVHLKMDDNGKYSDVKDADTSKSDLKEADNILRYSPHQVTLKPGESQSVKVMFRPTEGLAEGEYVSHLMFRSLSDVATGTDVEVPKAEDGKISIHLIPVYGVSIPVIARYGKVSGQANITHAKLSGNKIAFDIERSGNASVFGDITVTDGSGSVLGQANGVYVLPTNAKRSLSVNLSKESAGTLNVEFREREEDGGKLLSKTTVNEVANN